jgi:hypothetical protein
MRLKLNFIGNLADKHEKPGGLDFRERRRGWSGIRAKEKCPGFGGKFEDDGRGLHPPLQVDIPALFCTGFLTQIAPVNQPPL